jgi:hypothetical protein
VADANPIPTELCEADNFRLTQLTGTGGVGFLRGRVLARKPEMTTYKYARHLDQRMDNSTSREGLPCVDIDL